MKTAPFPKLPALAERLRAARRPAAKIAGAHECESLAIVDRTPVTVAAAQDLRGIGTGWSGDAQLFVQAKRVGDFLEIAIPAKEPGARKVVLHATRAPDYAMLRFTVNSVIRPSTEASCVFACSME